MFNKEELEVIKYLLRGSVSYMGDVRIIDELREKVQIMIDNPIFHSLTIKDEQAENFIKALEESEKESHESNFNKLKVSSKFVPVNEIKEYFGEMTNLSEEDMKKYNEYISKLYLPYKENY